MNSNDSDAVNEALALVEQAIAVLDRAGLTNLKADVREAWVCLDKAARDEYDDEAREQENKAAAARYAAAWKKEP